MPSRKTVSVLFTGGAAAAAIGIPATHAAATAGQTWTVTPGGGYNMKTTGSAVFTDIANSAKLTCTSESAGKVLAGAGGGALTASATGTSSAQIGTISRMTYGTSGHPCTSSKDKGVTIAFAAGTQPWQLNAYLYTASQGTTSGFVKGIDLTVAGAGDNCKATMIGSGTFRYANAAGTLALSAVLTVKSTASCPGGLTADGNEEFRGTYTVSPGQTITETS